MKTNPKIGSTKKQGAFSRAKPPTCHLLGSLSTLNVSSSLVYYCQDLSQGDYRTSPGIINKPYHFSESSHVVPQQFSAAVFICIRKVPCYRLDCIFRRPYARFTQCHCVDTLLPTHKCFEMQRSLVLCGFQKGRAVCVMTVQMRTFYRVSKMNIGGDTGSSLRSLFSPHTSRLVLLIQTAHF